MINPRTTRLLRVADLCSLHEIVADSVGITEQTRTTAVILPTRGAAEEMRRTLEGRLLDSQRPAIVLPELLTRADFYARLHAAHPGVPPLLTEFEREVLFRRAALTADAGGAAAPFRLRAGMVVEILALYDELRRRDRSVADFSRLMVGSLEPSAEMDRGAERLLRQTRFLVAAFEAFEQAVAATGRLDEHRLRDWLLARDGGSPFRRVVLTVADQAADAHGLWSADYALLTRVARLEAIDVVVTEAVLATGFHERIHELLPGIQEERICSARPAPVLLVPDTAGGGEPVRWFVSRDREEELVATARLAARKSAPHRVAAVFQRPLPYLYLARDVFADAAMPYQARDALPLAAEPFAAAIDLLFAFISNEATRAATVELLRSPHWRFTIDQREIGHADVASLDGLLRELKYVGGWEQLSALAAQAREFRETDRRAALRRRAADALEAAHTAAVALRAVSEARSASAQIGALRAFIRGHEVLPAATDVWYSRHLRARAAILAALDGLADAHTRYDDEPLPVGDLLGMIRRWMEGQTFSPRTGADGVSLLDATAAAFADVDEVRVLGLVASDWPERNGRTFFYPSALLSQLGWPADVTRSSAARARFNDLLRLAQERVSVSLFTLEDDAIVPPSVFLDELNAAAFQVEHVPEESRSPIFARAALTSGLHPSDGLTPEGREWLAMRSSRSEAGAAMFQGTTGVRQPETYAVSHLERYLDCPFKYFAAYVLRLDEERDDEAGFTAQERGQFVHAVFERFFVEWQASGRRAITTDNLTDALSLFSDVAEAQLATLPEPDRSMERTHLLGSAVAPGLAERAFTFEIDQGVGVVERLLEHALEGEFRFNGTDGTSAVRLRAKADRIDLLTDGTIRVIDYKLGRAPKPKRALQLPIYGICAEQHLDGRHGRHWTLGRAGYVAFREKNAFVELGGTAANLQKALVEGQMRLLGAVEAIQAGAFPVDPDEPWLCTRCGFATVCRKDYVGDE